MSANIEATVAAAANKLTGAGSAVTVLSWFNSSNFGMWVGIAIGVIGLAVNFYYKRRSDRRSAEAHRLYMSLCAYNTATYTTINNQPPLPDSSHGDLPGEKSK